MTRRLRQQPDVADEDVQREVERMLHLVLHEIRQPVAAIFALTEAARSLPEVPESVAVYLDQIVSQAVEIVEAASDVLAPEPAPTDLGVEPADVDEIIDSVLEAYGLTWAGTLARQGDRESTPILGSRVGVRRCLMNVVDNAVRAAGPMGTVTLTVRRETDAVTIVVEDDGPGFGRGPRGTGLGIEVARQGLSAIGGHLSVGAPSSAGGGRVLLVLRTAERDHSQVDRPLPALR
jgi:signal transduction histidine kinase